MHFAEPLWLLGLLLLPLLWWLERRWMVLPRRAVATLFLWREAAIEGAERAVRRRRPVALWRWLRRAGLLAAILTALARPEWAGQASPLVVVVDCSASMAAGRGAAAGGGTRLDEARRGLRAELETAGHPSRALLIAAGGEPRRIGDWSSPAELLTRLETLAALPGAADLPAAVALAQAEAAHVPGARLLVLTDDPPPRLLPTGIAWRQVGESADNLGIVALALRAPPLAAGELSAFVEVQNAGRQPRRTVVELTSGGAPLWTTELLLAAGERRGVSSPPLLPRASEVRVRLLGGSDALALDDEAFAVVPRRQALRLLWVSDGRPFVSAALGLHPGWEVTRLTTAAYRVARLLPAHEVRVLDGALPERAEPGAILRFLPGEDGGRAILVEEVAGAVPSLLDRGAAGGRVPLLVTRPARLEARDGFDELFAGPQGPLAIARKGGDAGLRREVRLGFDPEAGGLSRRVELPILLHQAIEWLASAGDSPALSVRAGQRWVWHRTGRPRGSAQAEPPEGRPFDVAAVEGSILVPSPDRLGVWRVRWDGEAREFAVSVLDARESNLEVRRGTAGPSGGALAIARPRDASGGRPFAPLLWALALALLAADGLLSQRTV